MQNQEAANLNKTRDNLSTKPLNLFDLIKNQLKKPEITKIECLLCDNNFDLIQSIDLKLYLAHLLSEHLLVISDVDHIGHFAKFIF